jgi:hypothetical protein
MNIKLEPIRPARHIKRVTAATVSFSKTGLVRMSVQAVKDTGFSPGKNVSIYRDSNNNLYFGEGQDFVLREIKHIKSKDNSLGFNNKNYIRDLSKQLDWPLGEGKMSHITYDLDAEPMCINGLAVYKLL